MFWALAADYVFIALMSRNRSEDCQSLYSAFSSSVLLRAITRYGRKVQPLLQDYSILRRRKIDITSKLELKLTSMLRKRYFSFDSLPIFFLPLSVVLARAGLLLTSLTWAVTRYGLTF